LQQGFHKCNVSGKKQSLVENGSPLETTRNNVENESSWTDQVDEEHIKNIIVNLPKNDLAEF